jgi:hypothetical protein
MWFFLFYFKDKIIFLTGGMAEFFEKALK